MGLLLGREKDTNELRYALYVAELDVKQSELCYETCQRLATQYREFFQNIQRKYQNISFIPAEVKLYRDIVDIFQIEAPFNEIAHLQEDFALTCQELFVASQSLKTKQLMLHQRL